jgi:hypothetical protein
MEEPNVIEFAHALGIALYDWQDPADHCAKRFAVAATVS